MYFIKTQIDIISNKKKWNPFKCNHVIFQQTDYHIVKFNLKNAIRKFNFRTATLLF